MSNILQLDHIFIWVKKNAPEIEFLKKAGFTSIISGVHKGQGTAGKYIFFLNFYIELLYISDETEALSNLDNFGCNYIKRSQWHQNKSSFLGLGLKMTSFDQKNIPFSYKEYKSDWMRDNGLLMATNNQNLPDPIVFILFPNMEFPNYYSIEEMLNDNKPHDFKMNHIHDNGITALTSYKIITTSTSDMLENIAKNGIRIEKGKAESLELTFDNHIKNKEIELTPSFPIVIKY
jgi:hypothetical protein